jgi:hypothetical protein
LRRTKAAATIPAPYETIVLEDPCFRYRGDVVKARITATRGDFEQLFREYDIAVES